MIHYCRYHPHICWDDTHATECPKCELMSTIGYPYLTDLRTCRNHEQIAVYDKDYGCQVCKINAEADIETAKPDPSTVDQALDNRIDELEGRAKEIIAARAERLLEKTGDHGNTGGGYRWL